VSRTDPVRAAGAVLWRRKHGAVDVALVHRPKYDDWSFPKGKLDPGETHEEAAVREVEEETACGGELGAELASTSYVDAKGRPKTVRYWTMELSTRGRFGPNDEIDEVEWVDLDEAARRLSYDHDLDVLNSFLEFAAAEDGRG
jgi:8-oxo-dGTP pyrophosphatase MutT (NUDIX family)